MDLVDRITEAIAPLCGWCQEPLTLDGPSLLYCGPSCQWEFNQLQGERLVGYREPTDLPMHVANLHEGYSPEVTPAFVADSDYVSWETAYLTSNLMPLREWMLDRLNATVGDFRDWSFSFEWAARGPAVPTSRSWLMRQADGFWESIRTHIPCVEVDPCASSSPWVVVEQPPEEQMPDLPAVKAEDLFTYTEDGSPGVASPQLQPPEPPHLRAGFGYELIAEQTHRRERRRW